MQALKEITFETNGTQKLHKDFKDYLTQWSQKNGRTRESISFSVSAKLSVSGEKREEAILPEVVAEYGDVGHVYLKFVVASKEDADEAIEAVADYRKAGFRGSVYLMPVGGVESVYHLNNRTVAELAMKMGYRYSDRLQVPLFKNAWGT
jgi:6-pyruvoyltetrahydropterin 2'-reductase